MARPDASDDELTWALDQADGQTLMRSLPQGLHTMLEQEGRQLSAGQRQRIALARAFLRNTPLVMLDEATHNLDPASEEALELPLATLLRGRTAITIAHRLSTIVHADRLLVLNQGRVEAFGSLAELGRQPGRLREYLSHYQGGIYDDTLVMD
jgi:ABC-type multidrug transport system fused ATPase/permease subunit